MRIKLPLGPIAKWVGNVVLAAAAQAIVDRLSRPKAKAEPIERPVSGELQEDVKGALKEAVASGALTGVNLAAAEAVLGIRNGA